MAADDALIPRLVARVGVAGLLPILVPAMVIGALWALPGDPVDLLCPVERCTGQDLLAARWGLDRGAVGFYVDWLTHAAQGDFGRSWRLQQGVPVASMLGPSTATTLVLLLLAAVPLGVAGGLTAAGRLSRRVEAVLGGLGGVPAVLAALAAAAWVEITYGALSYDGGPGLLRLGLGALILAVADNMLAASVGSVRALFEGEAARPYVRAALLRGESPVQNMLPNVLPAAAAQVRGRALQLLSGAVIVEVVLGIPGLGELLFDGTLLQDFGVVLGASFAFAVISSALMLMQVGVDGAVAWWRSWAPALPLEGT